MMIVAMSKVVRERVGQVKVEKGQGVRGFWWEALAYIQSSL